MTHYPTLISYEEAIDILHATPIRMVGTQQIHFKNALHRICAQNVCAKYDVPSYPTAAMDGYAISYDDIPTLLTHGLKIAQYNKAGNPIRPTLQNGYAIKTFTGSLMPINADTLIIVEHVVVKDNKIFLNVPKEQIKASQWIRQVGDNYKKNEILLVNGDKINAFEVGLLAELNQNFIQVSQKVKVGIVCTGDEIIEVGDEKTQENVVRSVNTHILESLCIQMWQEPIIYPLLKDNKAMIKATIERAINECDMVVSTGGMSKGDFDFTQEVIEEVAQIHFKGVRLKPGKPVTYASFDQKPILALPGFPNSCALTFLLFGSILLAKMQGRIHKFSTFQATLLENVKRADTRKEFRACEVQNDNGILQVSFSAKKSLQSSMVNNLTHDTALAILEENGGDMQKGEVVNILFLNHF